MADIIELAETLGKAIASSPQAANLRAARAAMEKEKDLMDLLDEYQKQADKIGQLEQEQKPVEVEDKHNLQELHDKLVASETFKKFTAAQVEYIDLMRRVNQGMRKELGQVEA